MLRTHARVTTLALPTHNARARMAHAPSNARPLTHPENNRTLHGPTVLLSSIACCTQKSQGVERSNTCPKTTWAQSLLLLALITMIPGTPLNSNRAPRVVHLKDALMEPNHKSLPVEKQVFSHLYISINKRDTSHFSSDLAVGRRPELKSHEI